MASARYDVLGIGNAIVDVLAQTDETFLATHGLTKGVMTLIDAGRAHTLYEAMPSGIEMSGGSAANTLSGIASLGGTGAYIGKVRNDQLGGVFSHDLRAVGIDLRATPATNGPPTARCLIFITPDAQRTMQTFLGVSVELSPDDIDETAIADSQVTYLEGYLFDPPRAKEAFIRAAEIAHAKGRRVALTLSDPFCVDRHRAAFQQLVEHHVDILFANEAELLSLYEAKTFAAAMKRLAGKCDIAAVTRSEKGSVIAANGELHEIKAEKVAKVVDTTGAGDLYAAGVLYGLTRGYELPICGRIGSIAAAEVISHYGARPETSLAKLVAQKLG
jgi:sugar/nucleoside kinase (ribokinase family)